MASDRANCRLLQKFVAHSGNVNCATFGRKTSDILATGGEDKVVNIWNIGNFKCRHRLAMGSPVEAVTFDDTETSVVAGGSDGKLKLWNVETGKHLRTLPGHKANVRCLDFHPFGDFFASGSLDTNLKIWDIRRKGCIQQYKGHTDVINCIRFSPDGRWIISGSEDNVVKLWDMTAGKMIHEFTEHSGAITSLEFHPNEFLLATASSDRTVKFWDLEKFKQISTTSREASRNRLIRFDLSGNELYSVSNGSMRTYSWEPANQLSSVAGLAWGDPCDISAKNESVVVSSISQNTVSIWEVSTDGSTYEDAHVAEHPNISSLELSDKPNISTQPVTAEKQQQPAKVRVQPKAPNALHVPARVTSQAIKSPPHAVLRVLEDEGIASRSSNGDGSRIQMDTPDKRSTPVVPAQRDKPLGLNMDAFLPPEANVKQSNMKETEILDVIGTGHDSMLSILASRVRSIQIVRTHWVAGKHKAAVETMIEMQDRGVIVDVMNIMIEKPQVWTLDLSMMLFPECSNLLESQYDSYICTGEAATSMILKLFGDMILQSIRAPPMPGGIDIAREERYEKCVSCQEYAKRIREIISTRLDAPGKVGSRLRHLDKTLQAYD